MESLDGKLAALLERKVGEVRGIRPLSAQIARRCRRARFVRKRGVPVLAVGGLSAATVLALGSARPFGEGRPHSPGARFRTELSGTSGANEWRLSAVADGPEHCLIVRIRHEGREVDTAHNCGVHVGDVGRHAGPGVTAVNAGDGMIAMMGQVGPAVASVSLETETGRQSIDSMPIPWETPPETRFYIFFVDRSAEEGQLSTYDAGGRLLRVTSLEFRGDDAFIRD